MGMLLKFSPKANTNPLTPSQRDFGTAQILLFTGIRYEREREQKKAMRKMRRARKGA